MSGVLVSLLLFLANAESGKCTEWKQDGSFCTFNGQSVRMWTRTCFHLNDLEQMCIGENPSTLKGSCTEWFAKREKCVTKNNKMGNSWERTCKVADEKTSVCLEEDPNTI